MPRSNDLVERALQEYADLLSIAGSDPYKPRAYEKAARAVGGYPEELAELDEAGVLSIPGVGRSIASKVVDILKTGSFDELDALRAQVPDGVRAMTAIPGFGPKKAMAVHVQLGIDTVEALVAAAERGELAGMKGFSRATERTVIDGVRRLRTSGGRVRVDQALEVAEELLGRLRQLPGLTRASYAGSLRRMAETIGDVDLLVSSERPSSAMDALVGFDLTERVISHGETRSSVVTTSGLQVDLRVVDREAWGAALIYFTGSKAHNVRIREIAVRSGLKLNEYGLFRARSGKLLAAETEQAVYERLGLPYIEPTLREDRGEIEAGVAGELPDLITLRQIRGDLHTHTNLTDGLATLERMLEAASEHRYAYYAVTDHAPNLFMQRMTDEKMLEQRHRLRGLQDRYPKMRLLHGTELNIDPDGGVDWDDGFLAGFDLTVASVHSHFGQSKDQMTRRVIRAIEHPRVNIIGHLTTRKIGRRDPIELDLEAVFAAAGRTGTALEINAYPDRLDLRDEHVLWAKRHGVRFAIDTDSHAVGHLDLMRFGVATAQRGWLTKDDVINAWPVTKLRRFLRKGRS
ncbi:MAG TPA: DNA polymerase/3'-5' exonuclease PolX [Actinomycetota bacterium]|nr:DNA polymerase/3'-5' exonuclease PolX [Actinomycetota bacterium]